jgi:hypothetical protein
MCYSTPENFTAPELNTPFGPHKEKRRVAFTLFRECESIRRLLRGSTRLLASLVSWTPSPISRCKAEHSCRGHRRSPAESKREASKSKPALCKPLRQGAKVQYHIVYLFVYSSFTVCLIQWSQTLSITMIGIYKLLIKVLLLPPCLCLTFFLNIMSLKIRPTSGQSQCYKLHVVSIHINFYRHCM